MINAHSEKSLLHVACPRECNMQLPPHGSATRDATPMQRQSLKAASMLVLERNKQRNNHATSTENDTQLAPQKTGLKVARVAPDYDDETVGFDAADWGEIAPSTPPQKMRDYTLDDIAELDMLINQVCDMQEYSGKAREGMLRARRTMMPNLVLPQLEHYRQEVEILDKGAIELRIPDPRFDLLP